MNYPMLGDFIYLNDMQEGINYLNKFNGLMELSQRKDGAKELLALYKEMKTEQVERKNINELPDNSTIHFNYIELLLSRDVFLKQLSLIELADLEKSSLEKYEEKKAAKEIYGMVSLKTNMLAGAKAFNKKNILKGKSKKQAPILDNFINNPFEADSTQLEEVYQTIKFDLNE